MSAQITPELIEQLIRTCPLGALQGGTLQKRDVTIRSPVRRMRAASRPSRLRLGCPQMHALDPGQTGRSGRRRWASRARCRGRQGKLTATAPTHFTGHAIPICDLSSGAPETRYRSATSSWGGDPGQVLPTWSDWDPALSSEALSRGRSALLTVPEKENAVAFAALPNSSQRCDSNVTARLLPVCYYGRRSSRCDSP
jgi:hypothetical protein